MKKIMIAILLSCFTMTLAWGSDTGKFIGTNMWYAPLLQSDRLEAELDTLQKLGINNVRIFIGGEGSEPHDFQIRPSLLLAPGKYSMKGLFRLDNLMDVLERRGMKGIFYLTNSWEWSGGFGTYLEWAGEGNCPLPEKEGYNDYIKHVSRFYDNDKAQKIFRDHVRFIVSRYNGRPAVGAWQLCNEPRPFSSVTKDEFAKWVKQTAALIKSIDPNTPVSIGSEGYIGCELDMDLWTAIHSYPEIDYCTIHIWPTNWAWASRDSLSQHLPQACELTRQYIAEHVAKARQLGKPLVISEFGYPRDGMLTEPGSPTTCRDAYYKCVLDYIDTIPEVRGINFWGWGGSADLEKKEYTSDPAHEAQGLYSVFACDSSTIRILTRP